MTHLDYGNWVRRRTLIGLGAGAVVATGLSLLPFGTGYRIALAGVGVALGASLVVPLYAYATFSQRGGRFQERLYERVADAIGPVGPGRILDIGAGNGMLAVLLAQRQPAASVVGVDTWGPAWEYAAATCTRNARLAGVDERVGFRDGDAARLPFADAAFDAVVSNLTFHEVTAVADKPALIAEALRVLKPGGAFAFVDPFFDVKLYGPSATLEPRLRALGVEDVALQPLTAITPVPVMLRHPRALGRVALLTGRKTTSAIR